MSQLFPDITHRISLQKAKEMTARYNSNKNAVIKKEYEGKIFMDCETFNREAFDAVLAQEGCVGVRIYFSMNEDLSIRTIIVGVNGDNQDILPPETAAETTDDTAVIVEDGKVCPPDCPTPPSLGNP